jgi:penicillin-binding protein 1A
MPNPRDSTPDRERPPVDELDDAQMAFLEPEREDGPPENGEADPDASDADISRLDVYESDEEREAAQRRRRLRRMKRVAWRWTRRLIVAFSLAVLVGSIGLVLVLRHYESGLPSTADLKHYAPPQVTRVLGRDGSVIAELFIERRTVVSISQVPKEMKVALLAAEDADFYQHEGLDYLGMLRALYVNVRSASARQGGSTITQQVVKNVLLSSERTFARKAREVLLARRIEQELSKDEILELYLNHIYFGHGRYGIEEAARFYFGKGVSEVSLAEAALLAGLPKGPGIYSPRVDYERARERRNQVLEQVALKNFASRGQVEQAKREPIVLAPAVESLPELAPEVVDEVRRTLRSIVGQAAVRGGYTVTTTIDTDLQAAARRAVRENLDAYVERHKLLPPFEIDEKKKKGGPAPFQGTPQAGGHHVYQAVVIGTDDKRNFLRVRVGTVEGVVRLTDERRYNPKALPASRFAEKGVVLRVSPVLERGVGTDGVPREFRLELGPQGALVAVDVATREIRALVGSYEAVRGGLDRASYARRQPGSSFKPFVYSYALHDGRFTPASLVGPEPSAQPAADPAKAPGKDQPPKEPPRRLRLREAVAKSDNNSAVWTLNEVGAESVVSWAHSLGIESRLAPTDSLALGAYEVTPRELAGAYMTFATGGVVEPLVLITRIVGPDGAELELPPTAPRRRAMDEDEAYVLTSVLTSVVTSGTGRAASALGIPIAGKTGTSNESKDAWFAGYSPKFACVVWTGFDDAAPLGRRESGAVAALPAFISLMRAAHGKGKVKSWPRPKGIVEAKIDPATGLLPFEGQENAVDELFLTGTEPKDHATVPEDGAGGAGGQASVAKTGEGGAAPAEPRPPEAPRAEVPSETPPPF